MDTNRWRLIKEISNAAMDLSDADRAAFVLRRCKGDALLCVAVMDFLEEMDFDTSELQSSISTMMRTRHLEPGDKVDAYRIVSEIGHGGMGIVYEAMREQGFQRKVALKVLKRGLDTRQIISRFEKERQILASLEHPNIATLHDGGATLEGLPYFAMEFVDGAPLIQWCTQEELGVNPRLRLFLKICEAVSYAHNHLVIHRDLKPGNIMVTNEGNPKLLDFGIASILDPEQAAVVSTIAATNKPMTPEYASPEQILGHRLTAATDIYAMGVLLFELLTDKRPFNFQSRNILEVTRVVCDQEPILPSSILEKNARKRWLIKKLQGDLDSIILKAMSKKPADRYASIMEFADDVKAHLNGHPIKARKITFWIRALRFTKRNWLPVSTICAILLAFATASIISTRSRNQAEFRRSQAEDLIGYMLGDLKTRLETIGRLDILDDVGDKAEAYFATLPESQMTGKTLDQHITALFHLGEVRLNQKYMDEAYESFGHALELAQKRHELDPSSSQSNKLLAYSHYWLGNTHYNNARYDQCATHYKRYLEIALSMTEQAPEDPFWKEETSYAHNNLGAVLKMQGHLDEALDHLSKSVEIKEVLAVSNPEDTKSLRFLSDSYYWLGALYLSNRKPAKAGYFFKKGLDLVVNLQQSHPWDKTLLNRLAIAYNRSSQWHSFFGDHDQATQMARESVVIANNLSNSDPSNLKWKENLVLQHVLLGRQLIDNGLVTEASLEMNKANAFLAEISIQEPNQPASLVLHVRNLQILTFILQGKHINAKILAKEILEDSYQNPGSPEVRRLMAEASFFGGKAAALGNSSDEASIFWNRFIDTDETEMDIPHLVVQSLMLLNLARFDEARSILDELRQMAYKRKGFWEEVSILWPEYEAP